MQNTSVEKNSGLKEGLGRTLPISVAIAIGIGATIGSGIFSSVGEIAGASGCALFVVLSFLLGGINQIPATLFYAEVASAYPESGGSYKYFELAGWRYIAFFSGMTNMLATDSPGIAIIALALARHIAYFFGFNGITTKLVAVVCILLFMYIHIRSVEGGGKFLNIITTFKTIPFIVLALIGFAFIQPGLLTTGPAAGAPVGIIALLAGISATSWSYDGITSAVCIAGEIKNPKKLPFAFITSVLAVTAIYTIFSAAVVGLLPLDKLIASEAPVAEAISQIPIFGSMGGNIAAAIGVVVIAGCLTSCIMYQPRVQYAMARDGLWFQSFGKVHPKYKTPAFSIAVQCTIAIVLVFFMEIVDLLGYFTFVVQLRSIAGYLVIFKFRKREDYKPTYKMPAWWLITGYCILSSVVLLFSTLAWAPVRSFICLGIGSVVSYIGYRYFENKYGKKEQAV